MIISAIYTDLISFISPSRALYRFAYIGILTLFSLIIIFLCFRFFFLWHFFVGFCICDALTMKFTFIDASWRLASSRESSHLCEWKVLHTITGTCWILESHGILRILEFHFRNLWHHSTSPCVQVCKYIVVIILFSFSRLFAGLWKPFHWSRQNSWRRKKPKRTWSRWRDWRASDSAGRGRNVTSSF